MVDRHAATDQSRRQLFRWLGWFAMANAVVLGVIGLRYLGGGFTASTPLAWVYLVTIYLSHAETLAGNARPDRGHILSMWE